MYMSDAKNNIIPTVFWLKSNIAELPKAHPSTTGGRFKAESK